MKKIFVVLATTNEDDIVESYCRYNLTFCDGILVYDLESRDNTNEIIRKLIAEGLPIYLEDNPDVVRAPIRSGEMSYKITMARKAIDEYGADLVVPLDADEFLYHTDGINPREALEAMSEDVEYQAIWRTYLYEREPAIGLGFMPNNFTHYRNPAFESPERYDRHKKTIASKHLIKDKQAAFIEGAHFLVYPEEHQSSAKVEIHEKLVIAHFPIRSQAQVMKKVIPLWIRAWGPRHIYRPYRAVLDVSQIGVLFNEIRERGEITPQKIKQFSLEYAMLQDANESNEIFITSREELDKMKSELGYKLTIAGAMDTLFCADKLVLRYTDYSEDNKTLFRAILKEVDDTVMRLTSEIDDTVMHFTSEIDNIVIRFLKNEAVLYLDGGSGFSEENTLRRIYEPSNFYFHFEKTFSIPANTTKIRYDPSNNFCMLKNLNINSNIGVITYKTNGYKFGDSYLFFTNDPQILIKDINGVIWLHVDTEIYEVGSEVFTNSAGKYINELNKKILAVQSDLDVLRNEAN